MSFLSMGKNVARNLFEGPATRRYQRKSASTARARGMIGIDIEACIFCGLCSRRCPTGALTVRKDPREWEIDRLRCILRLLRRGLPKKCLAMANHYSPGVTVREDAVHMERQAPRPAKEAPPEAKE